MAIAQVRVAKTDAMQEILDFLLVKYKGLTENDLVKLALSKFYQDEMLHRQELPPEYLSPAKERQLTKILEEFDRGEYEGPFDNAEDFLVSLKS